MMMVVTVMAVALHLTQTLREDRGRCQIISLPNRRDQGQNWVVRASLPKMLPAAVALGATLLACAQNQDREPSRPHATSAKAPAPEQRIDINHASIDELLRVPGLSRPWAGRIVRFRPYRTKLDLLDGGIVPDGVYERIKDFIIAHRDAQ